jgi:hypothetical protein
MVLRSGMPSLGIKPPPSGNCPDNQFTKLLRRFVGLVSVLSKHDHSAAQDWWTRVLLSPYNGGEDVLHLHCEVAKPSDRVNERRSFTTASVISSTTLAS